MTKFNYLILLCLSLFSFAQKGTLEYQYFRGTILQHNPDIAFLTQGHPQGAMLSYHWQTDGSKEWHHAFNFPSYGFGLQHVLYDHATLGENYGFGAFYQFYFWKRRLSLRVQQGIGYNTNPYHRESNPRNTAFGSHWLSNTTLVLQWQKEQVWKKFGIQAGLILTHFSNARMTAPNSGINVLAAQVGVQYHFQEMAERKVDTNQIQKVTEPIRYQFVWRTGANVGPIEGMPLRGFHHISLLADKRFNRKTSVQLGIEYFHSGFMKDVIQYYSVALQDPPNSNPEMEVGRIGILLGHEWFINQFTVETQLGGYLYKGFDYESNWYQRLALKYYWGQHLFSAIGLKTHGFRAEAMEIGLGIRI
jgi:hypothetical protein